MCNINYELIQWKECKYHIFRKPYPNIYVGTELLNYVLLSLQTANIKFNYIYGKLSSADAQNENWNLSIPFYANFCNYLNTNIN